MHHPQSTERELGQFELKLAIAARADLPAEVAANVGELNMRRTFKPGDTPLGNTFEF